MNPVLNSAIKKSEEMLKKGIEHKRILEHLVKTAELLSGKDTVSSILVVDDKGLLQNGASPGLPADYLKAIKGLKPHPGVGTCASAAATGQIVITEDFQADDKWSELRHLPQALGFTGA